MILMEPKPFEIYRHFKGNLYQIITLAEDTEAGTQLVVYQGLYPPFKVYARPLSMFMEKLDSAKYPGAAQEYRFERVSDINQQKTEMSAEVIMPTRAVDVLQGGSDSSSILQNESDNGAAPAPEKEPVSKEPSEETGGNDAGAQINQDLLRFLDAREAEEKLDVLFRIHPRLTPEMLTAMELSQGMEPQESWSIEERYKHIQADIITKQKYEQRRL